MQPIPINFTRNQNATIVQLDPKAMAAVKKAYSEHWFAMKELMERLKDDRLEEGFKETLLSLGESHLCDILKLLGYESALTKEKEERYANVRRLNEQNRELRKQLGEKVTNEDFRERAKNIIAKVNEWWKKEGTGFVKDEVFTEYAFRCKISGYIFKHNDEPVEERLTERGFKFHNKGSNDARMILDDNNLRLLKEVVKNRFPSSEIIAIKNHWGREAVCTLWDAEIVIYNLDEI